MKEDRLISDVFIVSFVTWQVEMMSLHLLIITLW